uniref:Uncharacterized protein n=1 Tax=Glossina pallidipes TaxID=7398 RepID=A0A1B0AJZ3_GLOPL
MGATVAVAVSLLITGLIIAVLALILPLPLDVLLLFVKCSVNVLLASGNIFAVGTVLRCCRVGVGVAASTPPLKLGFMRTLRGANGPAALGARPLAGTLCIAWGGKACKGGRCIRIPGRIPGGPNAASGRNMFLTGAPKL